MEYNYNYVYSRLCDIYYKNNKKQFGKNGIDLVEKEFDELIEKYGFDKASEIVIEKYNKEIVGR